MPVETLNGAVTGTNGSDGNAVFTVPSGVTPIGEMVIHDGFVRTPGVGYVTPITGPTITFLAPYIPIAGSAQPVIVYASTFGTGTAATLPTGYDYTTSGLIAAVRDLTNAGSSRQDWPDDKIIRLLNREIDTYLVPLILSARKDHFDTYRDQPLIGGQASYRIPGRAIGGKLRAVEVVDGTGNTVAPLSEVPLE